MSKLIDLAGKQIGNWLVIERAENDKAGQARWLCKCQCQFKTRSVVSGYALRSGDSPQCKRCAQAKEPPSNKKLEELYLCNGLSTPTIAEKYGVGTSTVARWLQNAGVPIRPLSEAISLAHRKSEKVRRARPKNRKLATAAIAESLRGKPVPQFAKPSIRRKRLARLKAALDRKANRVVCDGCGMTFKRRPSGCKKYNYCTKECQLKNQARVLAEERSRAERTPETYVWPE
ncbi:MAG: hypothetical protein JO250_09185 [Armatimonadetes bacterium]|nr:hypothetical protein [Armatimonadota bacterium]